jgi:mannosyl-oligosaccharide alpha-1,2-mannosidase
MLQQDKNEDHMRIWESSVDSIEKYMLSPSQANSNIKFVAMIGNDTVYYASQELVSSISSDKIILYLTVML